MSDKDSKAGSTDPSRSELHTELFLELVTSHAQMALVYAGRTPHPQTGQTVPANLDAARMLISQLEMLQAKTRGNLSTDESRILGRMLAGAQMAYVEALETPPPPAAKTQESTASTIADPPPAAPTPPQPPEDAAPQESKVRFSKKFE